MSTKAEVLEACVDQPLETILSLASTCSDKQCERYMSRAAAEHGRADLLDYLLHNATTSLEPRGMLLLRSAGSRSKACVQVMLDHGYDINIVDDMIGGVLHRALGSNGCPADFLTWLIARGALVNHPADYTNDQVHCLCAAVSHGSVPLMRLLVAAGADVDASKALHYAAWCGYVDRAVYLVDEAGADVDAPNGILMDAYYGFWAADPGSTPLHVAAANSQVKAAEFLLERGADVCARNAAGRTPREEVEYLAEIAKAKPIAKRWPRGQRWLACSFPEDHQEVLALLRQWESRNA
ncbi:Nuclear factor NF-kappa-B p105 subunit [Diplodia seriata]|uniref:Nuclear factor NF-kappa-B p105 subunit n=1 Tax=Diplodia seriata TaxID=420778 RepID=A0ABR3CAA7_9PEZI